MTKPSVFSSEARLLVLLMPWLLLCCYLPLPATAADTTASLSSTPLIPKTASNLATASAVPSRPPGPNIPHVKRPTTKDIYDDDDLTGPRLCRNLDHGDILLRVFNRQCSLPINSEATTSLPQSWSPWTHRPMCSKGNTTTTAQTAKLEYCVFTHAHYGDGGGISVVATPETAAGLAAILDRASLAGPSPLIDRPLLDVQEVAGKSLGVVARQAISRGTVLLHDHARLLADVRFPQHVRRAQGQTMLHKAAGRLPLPDDIRALSRSVKAKPGEPRGVLEENVLSTNSFAATVGGVAYMALFPEIARINHACNPTAVTRFNDRDLTQKVIAFRDIEPGEEITISYTDFGLTHDARQEKLQRRWGFTCTCDLCSGGADATAASDARRRRVTALRGEVVAHLQKGAFAVAIRAYEDELLGLVRTEHLAEHLGEHYEVLARLHLAAGNRTAAGAYAQRALDELETFEIAAVTAAAESATGSVQELRAFVQAFRGQQEGKQKKRGEKGGSEKGSSSNSSPLKSDTARKTQSKNDDREELTVNSRQEAAKESGNG